MFSSRILLKCYSALVQLEVCSVGIGYSLLCSCLIEALTRLETGQCQYTILYRHGILSLRSARAGQNGLTRIDLLEADEGRALCDGAQSLTPEMFDHLMKKVDKAADFF